MTYDPSEARDEKGQWTSGGPSMSDLKKLGATSQSWKTPDPSTMTRSAINRELDRLDRVRSQITTDMIQQGRGLEKPTETRTKTDALSLRHNAAEDRHHALHQEIANRYGPGGVGGPPSRLPPKYERHTITRRVKKL